LIARRAANSVLQRQVREKGILIKKRQFALINCSESLPKVFMEAAIQSHHQIIDRLPQVRYLADKEMGKKSSVLREIFSKWVPQFFPVH